MVGVLVLFSLAGGGGGGVMADGGVENLLGLHFIDGRSKLGFNAPLPPCVQKVL